MFLQTKPTSLKPQKIIQNLLSLTLQVYAIVPPMHKFTSFAKGAGYFFKFT